MQKDSERKVFPFEGNSCRALEVALERGLLVEHVKT